MAKLLTEALLPPTFALLASVLTVWIKGIVLGRGQEHRRRRRMSSAREEVEFLETWLKAHSLVGNPESDLGTAQANADLMRAYSIYAASRVPDAGESRGPRLRDVFRQVVKSILLLGRASRTPAKALRILYFVSLPWLVFVFAVLTASIGDPENEGSTLISVLIGYGLAFLIMAGLPALALRKAVLRLNRNSGAAKDEYVRGQSGPPVPVAPGLASFTDAGSTGPIESPGRMEGLRGDNADTTIVSL